MEGGISWWLAARCTGRRIRPSASRNSNKPVNKQAVNQTKEERPEGLQQEDMQQKTEDALIRKLVDMVDGGLLVCKNDSYSTILYANESFYTMVGIHGSR